MTICSCPLCDILVGFLLSMSWEHPKIIYKPFLLANNLNATEIFISYTFTRIAPVEMTGIVALSQSSFSTSFSIYCDWWLCVVSSEVSFENFVYLQSYKFHTYSKMYLYRWSIGFFVRMCVVISLLAFLLLWCMLFLSVLLPERLAFHCSDQRLSSCVTLSVLPFCLFSSFLFVSTFIMLCYASFGLILFS